MCWWWRDDARRCYRGTRRSSVPQPRPPAPAAPEEAACDVPAHDRRVRRHGHQADGLLLSTGLAKAFGSQITVVYVHGEEPSATSPEAERELADHADAVLAGTRERMSHARLGPRAQRALGAVSEDVRRAAPCAVAVAPRGDHRDGGYAPRRIAVGWIPTTAGEQTLDVARRIARVTGGGVEVVAPTSARATVASLKARAHHAVERVVASLRVRWRSRSGLVSGRRLRS